MTRGRSKRLALVGAICIAGCGLAGCIRDRLDPPEASVTTLRLVRGLKTDPLAVGPFTASGAARAHEQRIVIRGSTVSPGNGRSFSQYLREALIADLAAGGYYDPAATTRIEAELTENRASENLSDGTASLAATFTVLRDGRPIYVKSHRAQIEWNSNFIAAIAVPSAFRHYSALHSQLVQELLGDPAFQEAVRPSPPA